MTGAEEFVDLLGRLQDMTELVTLLGDLEAEEKHQREKESGKVSVIVAFRRRPFSGPKVPKKNTESFGVLVCRFILPHPASALYRRAREPSECLYLHL